MKNQLRNGFARLSLLLIVLAFIALALIITGIAQNNGSKKLFATPTKAVVAKSPSKTTAPTASATTPATTTSASPAPVKSSPTSKTPTVATSTVTTSANDQELATMNVLSLDTILEAYFSNYNFYPGTDEPDEFAPLATSGNYNGTDPVAAVQQDTTTPATVKYTYLPTPTGCSTAANNCQHFTLTATTNTGIVITQKQDINN